MNNKLIEEKQNCLSKKISLLSFKNLQLIGKKFRISKKLMNKSLLRSPQQQNFLKSLKDYEKKGIFHVNKIEANKKKCQEEDIFVDLKNVWHTNTKSQQKQYEAIRNSELFADQRKVTFVKFNYRNYQCKDINYQNVYNSLIRPKKPNSYSTNKIYAKGTMNVSELWSQKKLKEVIGNLPFPRDRLKLLKMYPKKNNKLNLSQFSQRLYTQ